MHFSKFEKNPKIIPLNFQRYLKVLSCYIFSLLTLSCSTPSTSAPNYLYPAESGDEIQRICRYVRKWGKRGFTVVGNQAHAIDPPIAPLLRLNHPLPEGHYQCGRFDVGKIQCAVGATRTLSDERCSFQLNSPLYR